MLKNVEVKGLMHYSLHAEQMLNRQLWLVCSLDFYLWGNLKQEVYRNNPWTLETLQVEIWNVILHVLESELQCVVEFHWCEMCLVVAVMEDHFLTH